MKAEDESSSSSAKTEVILLKFLLPLIEAYYSHFASYSPKISHIIICPGRGKKLVFVLEKIPSKLEVAPPPKCGVGDG